MNERINLLDLSALLAEKMAITKKETEIFLREYFEVINEELIKTKLIKIKDLGTFKLLWVEDRASVDVTTGERVLIPAHYKVTFTPDKKLAETVNEPFALFETTEIVNESGLEDLELLPDEDTLDESESESDPDLTSDEEGEIVIGKEPVPEEEEIIVVEEKPIPKIGAENIFEKESTPEEEEIIVVEEKPIPKIEAENIFEKESTPDEEPVSMDNPVVEEEQEPLPQDDLIEEDEEPTVPEIKPEDKELKDKCLDCYDRESYHLYQEKFFESQKKLKQERIILVILSILLVVALGYIAFRQFGKYIPFMKTSPIVTIIEPGIQKDSVPKISEALNDSIVPIEKTEETGKPAPPAASTSNANSKQITVHSGQTLRTIALGEYGNKVFWIYIYMENRGIIPDPDRLSVGMKITIPPAGQYGIDCNDPASIQKAKNASLYP